MAGFLDVVTPVTIANYALGALDGVTLHNPALKAMREKADWEYDVGGTTIDGDVEGGYVPPIISAPGQDLTPNLKSRVRYARWSQVWGEITGVNVLDNGALRRNSGKQALVKLRDKEVPATLRGMLDKTDGLLHQFFNQDIASPTQASGTVTGLPMAGLPSFLRGSSDAANLNGSDGAGTLTGVAVAAGDREAVCVAQTYGGLSLAPSGLTTIDNAVADAWQPTLVNSSSTKWSGAANVAGNILTYLQWAANRSRRFSSSDPRLRPDAEFGAWLSFDYFQYLGAAIAAKQTIYLSGGKGSTAPQVPLGTNEDALPHAGFMWRWDERMPTKTGMLITWPQVMARVQTLFAGIEGNGNPLGKSGEDAGLIETAITYDPVRRQWIVTGTLPMQFMCQPRYFTRIAEYA